MSNESIPTELEAIFSLLPDRCPNIFIAGGAAVDYSSATDIDIWFPTGAEQSALRFMNQFAVKCFSPIAEQLNDGLELSEAAIAASKYDNTKSINYGLVWHPKTNKPVNVLINTFTGDYTTRKLLNTFDLSCCGKGIHSDGEVIQSKHYTTPDAPIIPYNDSLLTLTRYFKYCAKFNQTPELDKLSNWFIFDFNYGSSDILLHPAAPAKGWASKIETKAVKSDNIPVVGQIYTCSEVATFLNTWPNLGYIALKVYDKYEITKLGEPKFKTLQPNSLYINNEPVVANIMLPVVGNIYNIKDAQTLAKQHSNLEWQLNKDNLSYTLMSIN